MTDPLAGLRNIRTRMLRPGTAEKGVGPRPPDIEERLAAHERRIHNHPCPCGSGKTYGTCCLSHPNQMHLELQHRRRMGMRDEDL
jgi:hypothetical protein